MAHSSNFVDRSGEKYGLLLVEEFYGRDKHGLSLWKCRCSCGTEKVVLGCNLKTGKTRSCGCASVAATIQRSTIHGQSRRGQLSPENIVWHGIKQRCKNPKYALYKDYGGRGVSICEEWDRSFETFFKDVGRRPSKEHSIERIDNDGNYEPGNCRWATRKEQCNNRRTNIWFEFNGVKKTIQQWHELVGIDASRVRRRIRVNKWTPERAMFAEPNFSEWSQNTLNKQAS